MSVTSTSADLRQAAREARVSVVEIVEREPGIHLSAVYERMAEQTPRWQEPAVRTAIWDLISERQVVIRRGNKLHPST